MKLKWTLLVLGLVIILGGYHMMSSKSSFVPDEMVGRWATNSPRYEGCYMELSSVSVVYGTRDGRVDVNFVQSVEKHRVEGDPLYTIHYKGREGVKGKVDILWNPLDQRIRLYNQRNMSWRRVEDAL